MPAKVVELDRYRPHLVIAEDEPAGKVHVIPLQLALDWAAGKAPLPDAGILRRILVEWLACVRAELVETALHDLEDVGEG